ncbi:MAG: hypothetical protein IJL98_00545 [Lachnospiraceae bacterium]|nr:hypothetical protein [Lachnospiraceae bacterium]
MLSRDIEQICSGILCVASLIGFVYSLIRFFKPRKALYLKMVGCALGCMFLERLYGFVQYMVIGDLTQTFQIGTFGTIGCYLFLFSANYGTIDSLMDDGSAELRKYRLAALAAPLVTVAAAVVILTTPSLPGRLITCATEELFVGLSAYYSLKHLIIPRKYSDFLSALRAFHAVSLLLALGTTVENLMWCYQVMTQAIWYIPYAILAAAFLALAPSLERGIQKWNV